MKKALVIAAAAAGILLAGAAAGYACFPGLPDYIKVRRQYAGFDAGIPDFEKEPVPADFVTYTVRGLQISVPPEYTPLDSGHGFRNAEGKTALLHTQQDKKTLSSYIQDYDPCADSHCYEAGYRHYFQAVGAPFPTDDDPKTDLMWYCRDVLRSRDVLHLRGRDRDVFWELAAVRDESLGQEETWRFSLPGGSGFVCKGSLAGSYWTLTLFPEGGGSVYDYVHVREPDDQTVRRIFSSVQLAAEES